MLQFAPNNNISPHLNQLSLKPLATSSSSSSSSSSSDYSPSPFSNSPPGNDSNIVFPKDHPSVVGQPCSNFMSPTNLQFTPSIPISPSGMSPQLVSPYSASPTFFLQTSNTGNQFASNHQTRPQLPNQFFMASSPSSNTNTLAQFAQLNNYSQQNGNSNSLMFINTSPPAPISNHFKLVDPSQNNLFQFNYGSSGGNNSSNNNNGLLNFAQLNDINNNEANQNKLSMPISNFGQQHFNQNVGNFQIVPKPVSARLLLI
jgi:hypothetical protein